MKDNKELMVAYCPPTTRNGQLLLDKDGNAVRPSTGHKFNIMSLYDLLFNVHPLSKMSPSAVKGSDGEIYAYLAPCLGIENARQQKKNYSDGLLFIDIDHLPKSDIETIFNAFDDICKELPNVLTCFYSNSYNNSNKPYSGLHFIVKGSDKVLEEFEYKELNTIMSSVLAWSIYDACGVDVRPSLMVFDGKVESCGLDTHSKNIVQRFYLNYSPVRWNDNCQSYKIFFDIDFLEGWFNEKLNDLEGEMKSDPSLYGMSSDADIYQSINKLRWFKKVSDIKITSCKVKSIDTAEWKSLYETDPDKCRFNYLSYDNRYKIANFLQAKTDWSEDDMIRFIFALCGPKDRRDGDAALINGIRQNVMAGRHWRANGENYPSNYAAYVVRLLAQVGININAEIEKTLTDEAYEKKMLSDNSDVTISIEVDDLLSAAIEEADKRIKEKQITLNLSEDEFICDYYDIIKEKIFKHHATYIAADPGVGKTTLAERLTTNDEYEPMFGNDFFFNMSGDELSIDICMPYNSVVDSKSLNNKQLKRILTADLSNYSKEGIKIFVWNTLKPIYEKYFNMGYKRAVFFFDESHKIVTDIYRWKVIFDMFKVLPNMYNHFVFMTGTPAYEHIFLKQYFDDMCFIKINKDSKYTYNCTFRNYDKFSLSDMTDLIRHHLDSGDLPMIYTNRKRADWTLSVVPINEERIARGERPLNVLYFNRDNEEDTKRTAKLKSIKRYDLVIATAYLNVGVDIYKDDDRRRVAIIDYANDNNAGYNEIWQFQGRNRQQDSYFEVICRTGEKYNRKKHAYSFNHYLSQALIHTHDVDIDVNDDELFAFLNYIYKRNKFGKLANIGVFKDYKNIVLLACYYMYIDKFTYIHNIKEILKNKGCKITEIDMNEHTKISINNETKKEVFKFYVEHIDEINKLQIDDAIRHKGIVKQIDLNTDVKDHICNGRIMSRDKRYMDWLYYTTANKEDWIIILKKCLEDGEILTKGTFNIYNKLKLIADNITDKELKNIKAAIDIDAQDDEDEQLHVDLVVEKIIYKHFKGAYSKKDIHTAVALSEIVNSYRDILLFIAENKEVIEIIKKHRADGTMNAALQMKIIKDTNEKMRLSKLHSDGAKKRNSKPITVRHVDTNEVITYDSIDALAKALNKSKQNLNQSLKHPKSKIHNVIEIVSF